MATTVANNLVDKLKEIQARDGLSNRKFARDKLGVSPELWRLTLNGQRRIGRAIQEGVLKAYPELKDDVVAIFLSNGVEVSTKSVDTPPKRHQRTPGQYLRGFGGRLRGLVVRFFSTDISIGDKH